MRARSGVECVIVTGQSGAGKSEAIHCFEDLGFFCVDNLPPALISKFAELCAHSDGKVSRAAVVIDVRGGAFFDHLAASLTELERMGFDYRIVFLAASDEALVRRYKETRRRHPLASDKRTLLESIREERRVLEGLKERAHKVIDTSSLPAQALKNEVASLFTERGTGEMVVTVVSFGYKFGVPLDADLVFDLRFLPNPHYIEELRPLSGTEEPVREFVLASPGARDFLRHIFAFLDFALPLYAQEGKAYLTIALGCTGGRHRSVALTSEVTGHLRTRGYRAVVEHRDVSK
ncbi:MAG: RNase adapter RapZ [Armatimonadota bacterium]|nr:MAG: RNase adapter RapZ [Armatimonadota bacterium]